MFEFIFQHVVDRARSLGGQQLADWTVPHVCGYVKMLRKLAAAKKHGNNAQIRQVVDRIYKSFGARVAGRILSAECKLLAVTVGSLEAFVSSVNAFSESDEHICGWAEPKHPGLQIAALKKNFRPIFAFGPKRRAVQKITEHVLGAMFEASETRYLFRGRGQEVAADKIVGFNKKGFDFVVTADISNCFGSVQVADLGKELKIPHKVVMNYLCVPSYAHVVTPHGRRSIGVFGGEGRKGLPQGSLVSGTIVSILLSPMLELIAPVHHVILYGDDILIAANNELEAKKAEKVLGDALLHHPFGPFRLKHSGVYHFNDGFDYLNYRHRRRPFTGKQRLRPSTRCFERVIERARLKQDTEGSAAVTVYLERWMKSFPKWKKSLFSRQLLDSHLLEYLGRWFSLSGPL